MEKVRKIEVVFDKDFFFELFIVRIVDKSLEFNFTWDLEKFCIFLFLLVDLVIFLFLVFLLLFVLEINIWEVIVKINIDIVILRNRKEYIFKDKRFFRRKYNKNIFVWRKRFKKKYSFGKNINWKFVD